MRVSEIVRLLEGVVWDLAVSRDPARDGRVAGRASCPAPEVGRARARDRARAGGPHAGVVWEDWGDWGVEGGRGCVGEIEGGLIAGQRVLVVGIYGQLQW